MSRSEALHPLRLERRRRNLSQRMLADFTGLSLATIVRAERGESIGADGRQRLCEYLGKTTEELGLIVPIPSPSATAMAGVPAHDPMIVPSPPASTGPGALSGTVSRRHALKQLGQMGMAGLGAAGAMTTVGGLLAGEPWERLARILRPSSSVDGATLAHLRAITTSYWHLRANRTSRELLAGILGHLHTVTDLLDSSGSPGNRRELIAIAGDAALVGGQIAFDVDEHAAARGYYRVALEAASEAQLPALHAVALARTSFTFTERGDPLGALTLVQRAQTIVAQRGEAPATVLGWLHAIAAEAYASLGDDRACLASLERAEHALQASDSEAGDRYWTGFDRSRLAGIEDSAWSAWAGRSQPSPPSSSRSPRWMAHRFAGSRGSWSRSRPRGCSKGR
jgi:hypothetical protein